MEYIARCVDYSGTREFFNPFLDMIHIFFEVDQCMIFFLDSQSRVECLLSRNFQNNIVAAPLAKAYINNGYRSDPNLTSIIALSLGETKTIHLSDMQGNMAEAYREQFFKEPHLTDKVSILTADELGRYYINFYRGKARSTFIEQDLFTSSSEGHLIAAIVTQHYRLNETLSQEGPLALLSARERQVCHGMLQGKKMETISAEEGIATSSVITYKKRAYAKLGINNRASLFALCRKN